MFWALMERSARIATYQLVTCLIRSVYWAAFDSLRHGLSVVFSTAGHVHGSSYGKGRSCDSLFDSSCVALRAGWCPGTPLLLNPSC